MAKEVSIPPTYPPTHFIQVATCEYTEEVSNKNRKNEAHSSLECSDVRKDRPGKPSTKIRNNNK